MTIFYFKQYGNVFEARLAADSFSNAWQGRVILPGDIEIKNVVYGESIGDVWQTPPTAVGQEISFAGGRTEGWSGDGLLFRFTLATKTSSGPPQAELIRFDVRETAAYAADGKGTDLGAVLQPITINTKELLSGTSSLPALPGDVPPEPFTIVTVHDPAIFDGKLSIVFSTTDSGVGIDHYEAREHTRHGIIGWHTATSPYLVDPETTKIFIRAIDRNGNFRVESIVLREGISAGMIAALIGISILTCLLAFYFIKKWRKER